MFSPHFDEVIHILAGILSVQFLGPFNQGSQVQLLQRMRLADCLKMLHTLHLLEKQGAWV